MSRLERSFDPLSLLLLFGTQTLHLGYQLYLKIIVVIGVVPMILAKNNDFPLYQSEAIDVLKNAIKGTKYQSMYLSYHGCVWSEYGNGGGGDDGDNGCGGEGNDDELWYMGYTQCFRANVAYSLYGVPKGKSTPSHPCKGKYFINSFFTTQGIEYFAEAANIDADDASSDCEEEDSGDGRRNLNNDDNYNYIHNGVLYPNAQSQTLMCSAEGRFVTGLFQGAYCSGSSTQILDDLDDLNMELENLNCVQVYSTDGDQDDWYSQYGDDYKYYGDGGVGDDDNQQGNDDGVEEGDDGVNDDGDDYYNQGDDANNNENARMRHLEDYDFDANIFNVLAYSEACSIAQYPLSCPDPWGAKKVLDYSPLRRTSAVSLSLIDWATLGIFLLSLFVLFLSCCCNFDSRTFRKERKQGRSLVGKLRKSSSREDLGSSSRLQRSNSRDNLPGRRNRISRWFKKKILRRKDVK